MNVIISSFENGQLFSAAVKWWMAEIEGEREREKCHNMRQLMGMRNGEFW